APGPGATPRAESRAGTRRVYWAELGDFEPTAVFWGERLEAGNRIAGPAIVQVPDTTIVVHPGQAARLDPYGHVLIDLHGEARHGRHAPSLVGVRPLVRRPHLPLPTSGRAR